MNLPWKTKGICLKAPMSDELDLFEEFIEKILYPGGCNLIVMIIDYRYNFRSHPECAEIDTTLTEEQIKRMLGMCRKHNIRLIPLINLMGHQSIARSEINNGLLQGHPEFDETPDKSEVFYCRSLCPRHPDVKHIVFDLMDEIIDVFETDCVHVGCDEVFELGECSRCEDTPTHKLFAEWVNALSEHNKTNGIQTMIWGDRLLSCLTAYVNAWEAAGNGTDRAIKLLDKDIIICDWHYEDFPTYPSVDVFAEEGFKILISTWRNKDCSNKFIAYAKEHDKGHVEGLLATAWVPTGIVARYMLRQEVPENVVRYGTETLIALGETLGEIFDFNRSVSGC